MKHLSNNKGYSLVLALGVVVLITVLGLSLMVLTSNGIKKNETRQSNFQSKDLAEKGVQYLVNGINHQLNISLSDIKNRYSGVTIDTLLSSFNTNYQCLTPSKSIKIDGKTGNTSVCIKAIESAEAAKANKRNNTRLVTFLSTGSTPDGKKFSYESQVELGYSDIPGQLSYAVSTNEGGNLYLFGGTEIRGNVYVDGNLYTSNKAFWDTVKDPTWVNGVYPKLISSKTGQPAMIYSNKKVVNRFKSLPGNLDSKTNSIYSDGAPFSTEKVESTKLNTVFSGAPPIFADKQQSTESINITGTNGKFEQMEANSTSVIVHKDGTSNTFKGAQTNNGSYTVPENKVLHIKNQTNSTGHMRIGRYSVSGSSDNQNNYYNYSLSGNYYVDGNVYLKGVKLKANAVIYVKGSVEIEYSTIQPLNNGTLFIFAEGDIKINNISVGTKPGEGSNINGYFYSNSNFTMYGVGSNTTITGGISAKHTTFTTLRGNAQGKGTTTLYKSQETYEELACLNENNDPTSTPKLNQYNQMDAKTRAKAIEWLTNLKTRVVQTNSWSSDFTFNRVKYNYDKGLYYSNSKIDVEEIDQLIQLINNPLAKQNSSRIVRFEDIGKTLYINGTQRKVTYDDFQNVRYVYETYSNTSILDKLKTLNNNWNNDSVKNKSKSFSYVTRNGNRNTLNNYVLEDTQWASLNTLLKTLYEAAQETQITNKVSNKCIELLKENRKYRYGTFEGSGESDSEENQHNNPSRLTIIYDRDLVNRYKDTTSEDATTVQDLTVMPAVIKSLTIIN